VTRSVLLGAAVVGGLACAERREADAAGQGGEAAAPADSLAMMAGDSTGIWFTLARPDTGIGGDCTERAIEIRRGAARVPVPLLYTGGAPELVNDTTIRARLWNDCRPGDAYLVDLRTGRPVRERR
jgi:hypothetical protein